MRNLLHRSLTAVTDDDRQPFDATVLEREIEAALNQPGELVPLRPAPEDVGKLTSEIVLQSYETGAQSLETLRDELKDMLSRNDAMVREANDALKQIEETITSCRESGKLFALKVAAAADMVKEIRAACEEMNRKIVAAG